MATGTIRWFSDARGYGLVDVHGHNRDAFVHYTDLDHVSATIEAGAAVEFTLEKGDQLDRARDVTTAAGTPFGPMPQDEPEAPSPHTPPPSELETPDADRDDDAEARP